jgi:hypothetical protein
MQCVSQQHPASARQPHLLPSRPRPAIERYRTHHLFERFTAEGYQAARIRRAALKTTPEASSSMERAARTCYLSIDNASSPSRAHDDGSPMPDTREIAASMRLICLGDGSRLVRRGVVEASGVNWFAGLSALPSRFPGFHLRSSLWLSPGWDICPCFNPVFSSFSMEKC